MINKKIKVVPNGVNTNQFRPLNKEEQKKWVENYFGVDLSSELNIINVGRLSQEKGLRYLVKSVAYLTPTTRLFLAGDGPEKKELKKLVGKLGLDNNVIFLGKIAHEKLPELLNAMDVFVLPAISIEGDLYE